MTRYRAIDIIKNEIECVNRQDTCEHKCADCELVLPDIEIFEAYDMAISALEQTDDDDYQKDMDEMWSIRDVTDTFERHGIIKQEPCEDAVSRQAVINAIENDCMKGGLGSCFACYNDAQAFRGEIEKLPSVTPKLTVDAVSREAGLKILWKAIEDLEDLPSLTNGGGGK